MAKSEKAATVKLTLVGYYTFEDKAFYPGDVIEVDAAEAEHLLAVGGAKAYEPDGETPAAE